MVEPRPRSKISRSGPASTSVDALKLPSRGVGVPVPSSVTLISAALTSPAKTEAATDSTKPSLIHIERSSGPPAFVDRAVRARRELKGNQSGMPMPALQRGHVPAHQRSRHNDAIPLRIAKFCVPRTIYPLAGRQFRIRIECYEM